MTDRDEDDDLGGLMSRAQSGDGEAYRRLLVRTDAWLRRFFLGKVPAGQVDDVVQDTLLSLHDRRSSYDPSRSFLPWLAAIARYRWIDHLRRRYRRSETPLENHDLPHPSSEGPVIARMSLQRLLERLPRRQAEAIVLVRIQGLSVREAAHRCGQSEAAIKVNVHRGISRMSGMIEISEGSD